MYKDTEHDPKVSVIVPIKQEQQYIEECLKRLLKQTYPKSKTEILVVDGMSEDQTRQIVNRELDKANRGWPGMVRLLDNPKGQRASAMNIGIEQAKYDVIIRVDARTIIADDYIEKCVKTLIETGAENVGGVQKPTTIEGPNMLTQEAIGIALSNPFGIGNAQFRIGTKSGFADTVYLGCFRKEVFDKVGLFDEEASVMTEDSDINYRIKKAGGRVYLDKDIVAYYSPRDSIRELWKLYFRYGGARAGFFLKHKNLSSWRQFVPPCFLLFLLVFPFLGFIHSHFIYLWAFAILTYVIVDFVVCCYLSLKEKRPALLAKLLFVFPTLHFAWASGFWRRLLQRPRPGKYWGY